MDILGVGPLEIILVIILALVVLGPQDMVVSARKIGAWIRKMVRSPLWREIMETSREIREIPTTLIRDSGIQEAMTELKDAGTIVKNELGEATHELSSEVQQANQELNAEAAAAAADVSRQRGANRRRSAARADRHAAPLPRIPFCAALARGIRQPARAALAGRSPANHPPGRRRSAGKYHSAGTIRR